ncbi:MAG: ABC transporter ATP-binding protein [Mesorhizobium sp.]|nr:ABC transporter ATP-binding protein [Mesorhizobium sp.]
MSGSVKVERLTKDYGAFRAINQVSLDVAEGEFVALLGPSGSGKSTILTSIAGFTQPTSGAIHINGMDVTGIAPHKRNIGMVFQRYALFPHMTVAENIAYPLRRRNVDRRSIEAEVARALQLVNLRALGGRYPSQLSGGQQQRVALARAIVFKPPVLLMDEPLGALDRQLRQQMQMEVKLLHREIGTTIVFVTHDQEEALSMSDRVVVLNNGEIQQQGEPRRLYEQPDNAFVANFLGKTNLIEATVEGRDGENARVRVPQADYVLTVPLANVRTPKERGLLGFRPERIELRQAGEGIPGRIVETAYVGSAIDVLLETSAGQIMARLGGMTAFGALRQGSNVGIVPASTSCFLFADDRQ